MPFELVVKHHKAVANREFNGLEAPDIKAKGLTEPMFFNVYAWNSERRNGYFTLAPLPGCCGVVVSIDSYLAKNEASGKIFHELKAAVARELGYSRMIATTQTRNFPELIGAAKNGWKMHEAFINKRTGEQLTVMEKAL
jgi:hypothetical protein